MRKWMAMAAFLLATGQGMTAVAQPRPGPRSEKKDPVTQPSGEVRPPAGPTTAPAAPATQAELVKASVTEHELKIEGNALKYKATAGTLAMKDEAGKSKADMFFVAYEKLGDEGGRPITFVFNGGPGAAAVWLHLGTAGPKRVDLTEIGEVPPPPHTVVDNPDTWLRFTDLVFIDPVGTGFSRPAQGEDPKQFFGVEQDIASMGDFIRLYTTRYQRWNSPKFLAGESYGTTRAAALSEYLMDRLGIGLNGIVFISTVLNFQTLDFGPETDLPYPLYLPSYTANAWYHKKLSPELQKDREAAVKESRDWALGEYAAALAKGDALSDAERTKVEEKLARLTGLPTDIVHRADMRIDLNLFRSTLLRDSRQLIGRFDGRITGYDPDAGSPSAEFDPSLPGYLTTYTSAFNTYVRQELKYESDLPYEVLTGRVRPWDYGPAGNGYLYVANRLRNAMIKDPYLKVMFASGYYDLATPFFATDYTVNHLSVGPTLRKNISQTYYDGGHMMYHNRADLKKLGSDIGHFMEQSLPKQGTRPVAGGAGEARGPRGG